MTKKSFDGAAEFARLASQANKEPSSMVYPECGVSPKNDQDGLTFWFAVTLLIGLILRLFKIVDDDDDSDLTNFSLSETSSALRSIGLSMFALSKGVKPHVALQIVMITDDGGISKLFVCAEKLVSRFEEGGSSSIDGVEIRKVLRSILADKVPSSDVGLKSDVRKDVVLPTPSSPVSITDLEDESLLGSLFTEAEVLSTSDMVFHLSESVSSCECMRKEYHDKVFPFDCQPQRDAIFNPEDELMSVGVVVSELLRKMNNIGVCETCNTTIANRPFNSSMSEDTIEREVPSLKQSQILSSIEDSVGEMLTAEGYGVNPERIGKVGGLGYASEVLSGLLVSPKPRLQSRSRSILDDGCFIPKDDTFGISIGSEGMNLRFRGSYEPSSFDGFLEFSHETTCF